jgi:hypothetical protein
MTLLASPRRRRRLTWVAVAAVVCLGVVALVLLIPNTTGNLPDHFSNTPVQVVTNEEQVPVTPAMRRQVNALFDAFVPRAVARRDPAAAYDLVTAAFRGDGTKTSWRKGEVPVFPYQPKGGVFHGWRVDTSFRDALSLELDLEPAKAGEGPVSYDVELRRRHGRWLIDSFVPRATYAPVEPAAGSKNGNGREEPAASALPEAKTGLFWVLMLGFLGLIVAVPVCYFAAQWIGARRGRRRTF